MGLLTGSASVTRCIATSRPDNPEFDDFAFEEILPGSTVRERVGFLPFEPGAQYQIGQHRWAFRVRIDTLKPDGTAVQEHLKELIRAEKEATGTPFIHPRKRRTLKQLAEEELLLKATPRSRVIECCLDDHTVWVGTTAKTHIGTVLGQLYQLFMSVVPYMGALLNINPFDQPAVERIKKFTFGLMGRKGFEDFGLKLKENSKNQNLVF